MRQFLFGALAALPVLLAQTPPSAYTIVQTGAMFGPPRTITIHRDGDLVLFDSVGETRSRSLQNISAHTSVSWDPSANPPIDCSNGTFSGDWGDPFVSSAEFKKEITKQNGKQTGTEKVNGFATQVWEADGAEGKAKIWIDPASGLIIKAVITAPNQPPQILIDVKKFTVGKPPAALFGIPTSCSAPAKTPTPPSNPDFVSAITPSTTPSQTSCAVVFRVLRAETFEPVTGLQVGVNLAVDFDHPNAAVVKPLTRPYRIDNAPAMFDLQVHFPDGGEAAGLIYRQCFSPRTVLLLLLKNPAKVTDGAEWVWAKSGKLAQ